MRRAQQGDEEAYAELLVLLAAVTRSYVRSRLGAPVAWIDDAVQETLVAVHNARQTFDGGRPFAPWFYTIAHHRFVDVLRREQRVRNREIGVDTWPEVAHASDDGAARVETANGNLVIRYVSQAELGTIDFHMNVAPGVEAVAYSRVLPREDGAEHVFTQFQAAGMPDAVLEAQVATLGEELRVLQAIFRARQACPA